MVHGSQLSLPQQLAACLWWSRDEEGNKMTQRNAQPARQFTSARSHRWKRFLSWPPTQLQRIREFMLAAIAAEASCGQDSLHAQTAWHTLGEISSATGYAEPSVSAQLRHLRKPRFGGYRVIKRRRASEPCGRDGARCAPVWEYRVVPFPKESKPEAKNQRPAIINLTANDSSPASSPPELPIAKQNSPVTHPEGAYAEARN